MTKPRILIADTDRTLRREIRTYGEFAGLTFEETASGITARDLLQKNCYDLALLSVSLPDISGIALLEEKAGLALPPVIILSNGYDELECLRCFRLGAEDYAAKPLFPKELVMRIHVILGETASAPPAPTKEQLTAGPLSMDSETREVFLNGEKQELQPKAAELLLYFMEHRGEALSRKQLMKDVWNKRNSPFDRTLDTHVKLLRTMLSEHRDMITTVRRIGYRFDVTEPK